MIGLGGNTSLGIGLLVYLEDKFTKNALNVTASMRKMGMAQSDITSTYLNNLRALQVGGGWALQAASVMTGGFARAIDAYSKYNYELTKTREIGEFSEATISRLDATTRGLAVTYGRLPVDIMKANLALAKGGVAAGEIGKMTEAVVALSTASDEPVDHMGDMLINIMSQFGASSDKAMHFADVLTMAANKSTVGVGDLFESIKYGGSVAASLNIPFEELATTLAVLGNAGLRGTLAGTSVSNMYRYLTKSVGAFPLKKQILALKELGLTQQDLVKDGKLRAMPDLISMFFEKSKGKTNIEKQTLFEALFGVRGERAFIPMLQKGVESYGGLLDQISNKSEGTAKRIATAIQNTSVEGRIMQLRAMWDSFKITVGEAFRPLLMVALPMITTLLRGLQKLAESPLGKLVLYAGALFAVFAGIAGVILIPLATMGLLLSRATLNMSLLGSTATMAFRNILVGLRTVLSTMPFLNLRGAFAGALKPRYPAGTMVNGMPVGGQFYPRSGPAAGRTIMTSTFGPLGGRIGRSFGSFVLSIEKMLAGGLSVAKMFGILGKGLGFIFKGLFSWPVIIADIAATLIFGKGIFEMLWDVLKMLANGVKSMFGWLMPDEENSAPEKQFGGIEYVGGSAPSDLVKADQSNMLAKMIGTRTVGANKPAEEKQPVTLHIYLDGQKTMTEQIDMNQSKSITGELGYKF